MARASLPVASWVLIISMSSSVPNVKNGPKSTLHHQNRRLLEDREGKKEHTGNGDVFQRLGHFLMPKVQFIITKGRYNIICRRQHHLQKRRQTKNNDLMFKLNAEDGIFGENFVHALDRTSNDERRRIVSSHSCLIP